MPQSSFLPDIPYQPTGMMLLKVWKAPAIVVVMFMKEVVGLLYLSNLVEKSSVILYGILINLNSKTISI